MFELLTSVFGGGLTGLIGSIITRIFDYKTKKLDIDASRERYAHERELRKIDVEIMDKEWTHRTQVAQIESEGREAVADAYAFSASFNEAPRYTGPVSGWQAWAMIGLDIARGLVRPGLTVYLCAITTWVYLDVYLLLGGQLVNPEILAGRVIDTVLYLTTTCVLWWFGTRVKTPLPIAPTVKP